MVIRERKNRLGMDMTPHGALPMFIDFMKTYLKDKPKRISRKAQHPDMTGRLKRIFRHDNVNWRLSG
jgi:membrane carboxypeptidase/penicillin-binding protein